MYGWQQDAFQIGQYTTGDTGGGPVIKSGVSFTGVHSIPEDSVSKPHKQGVSFYTEE